MKTSGSGVELEWCELEHKDWNGGFKYGGDGVELVWCELEHRL